MNTMWRTMMMQMSDGYQLDVVDNNKMSSGSDSNIAGSFWEASYHYGVKCKLGRLLHRIALILLSHWEETTTTQVLQ